MGPTPVYGARAEKPLQNADFAMKQTNICRLSGDIITFIILTEKHRMICYYSLFYLTCCISISDDDNNNM